MQAASAISPVASYSSSRPTILLVAAALAAGVFYAGHALFLDLSSIRVGASFPYVMLGVALLIALGFEFVNGFHDTANAVATVIYTHSLQPQAAVLWSGLWNFLGVLFSSGAVAFGIIALLPVELILQVGSGAGFAMVFSLLLAAILWNLGTWYLGLPASSSHTLIGSIIGVGLANQLMQPSSATSGVEWSQVTKVGYSLLLSPLIGFTCAAILLLLMKVLTKNPALFLAPVGNTPPPGWIRGLLILTCTGVSFAHGSNDGQKGMGLIMLILIGTVPMAYALDRAVPAKGVEQFVTATQQASQVLATHESGVRPIASVDPHEEVTRYIQTGKSDSNTIVSLRGLMGSIATQVSHYATYGDVPDEMRGNIRNDMYLTNEALRRIEKQKELRVDERGNASVEALSPGAGPRNQIHSHLGQGDRGHRAGFGNDGGLETDRRDGGRTDWQKPSHVRAGRGGRACCHDNNWSGRCVWVAGQHDTGALFRRRRYDGSQSVGASSDDDPEYLRGMDSDVTHVDRACRRTVYHLANSRILRPLLLLILLQEVLAL